MIRIKRAYEAASATNGKRFLVDRLWPRAVRKTALKLDGWLKDVAPSNELRRWFGHDPAKWDEFRRRYFEELDSNSDAWQAILIAARKGRVTLIFSARDVEHNNAVALKEYLDAKLKNTSRGKSST